MRLCRLDDTSAFEWSDCRRHRRHRKRQRRLWAERIQFDSIHTLALIIGFDLVYIEKIVQTENRFRFPFRLFFDEK